MVHERRLCIGCCLFNITVHTTRAICHALIILDCRVSYRWTKVSKSVLKEYTLLQNGIKHPCRIWLKLQTGYTLWLCSKLLLSQLTASLFFFFLLQNTNFEFKLFLLYTVKPLHSYPQSSSYNSLYVCTLCV